MLNIEEYTDDVCPMKTYLKLRLKAKVGYNVWTSKARDAGHGHWDPLMPMKEGVWSLIMMLSSRETKLKYEQSTQE